MFASRAGSANGSVETQDENKLGGNLDWLQALAQDVGGGVDQRVVVDEEEILTTASLVDRADAPSAVRPRLDTSLLPAPQTRSAPYSSNAAEGAIVHPCRRGSRHRQTQSVQELLVRPC